MVLDTQRCVRVASRHAWRGRIPSLSRLCSTAWAPALRKVTAYQFNRQYGENMKGKLCLILCLILALAGTLAPLNGSAAVTQLPSPGQLVSPVTINFDGYPDDTPADTLYQSQGLTFTRGDGIPVYIFDFAVLNRGTTSPPNVLGTIYPNNWTPYLDIIPTAPITALGTYFGNDQLPDDFATFKASAFGQTGTLLGSVAIAANQNTDVDQFIGFSSDTPIYRVRLENLKPSGAPSSSLAVVIDDLMFVPVPEPTALSLLGLGTLAAWFWSGLKRPSPAHR